MQQYGTVQKWFDKKITEEFEDSYEAEVVKEETKETVSAQDF